MKAPALWDPRYRSYWADRAGAETAPSPKPASPFSERYARHASIPRYPPREPLNLQPPGPWSAPDRRRRSRIDWSALIDDRELINRQEGFERNATALAMRDAGMTYEAMGECMGVTRERARQMVNKALRQRGKPAPIEAYLQQSLDDLVPHAATLRQLRAGDWRAP
jgi:hypothetical protein